MMRERFNKSSVGVEACLILSLEKFLTMEEKMTAFYPHWLLFHFIRNVLNTTGQVFGTIFDKRKV
jgi:hypothetical protein